MYRFAVLIPGLLLALLLPGVSLIAAAQNVAIPATAPTQSVSDLPSARPATLPYQPRTSTGSHAVQWDGSTMAIHASGEDLPAILTEVSHATGLKVTGGVPDERVFGVYGPGSVQQVVTDLFGGLYVNLLLVNGTATQPKELILSPRTGGPTPPSPARSIAYEPQQPNRNDRPFRGTPPQGAGLNQPSPGSPLPGVDPSGPGGAPGQDPNANSTTDANGQPQSPNGVLTPEQIFEKLRKQQAAQQGGAATQ
jgi:hypothetical protein